jgi:phosphate transport system protein
MELQVGKEIEHIREYAIRMATLAEEAVRASTEAFLILDTEKAKNVIINDRNINELELQIDKSVFECLALKAPVAVDLRFLFSIQKMNKDLERIGDHAVNIAQAAINCSLYGNAVINPDIQLMVRLTNEMFSNAVTSFIKADSKLALKVMEQDDQIDELNRLMTREVINTVKKDINTVDAALELLRVSKNLERIADLSTNIAEVVIFHSQAKDVKHHKTEILGTE